MGSFKGNLNVNGTDFDVIWHKLSASRKTTTKGKVATGVERVIAEFRVEAKAETVLAEAMFNSFHKTLDWEFTYSQAEDKADMRKTKGFHAYLVKYEEVLDTQNEQQAMIYIQFASETVEVGGATAFMHWANNA